MGFAHFRHDRVLCVFLATITNNYVLDHYHRPRAMVQVSKTNYYRDSNVADARHRVARPYLWLQPVSAESDEDIKTPSEALAMCQTVKRRLPMLPDSNLAEYEF